MPRKSIVTSVAPVLILLAVLVSSLAAGESAAEVEVQSKSWFDLFKATGLVGILLALLSTIGTALLIQYYVRFKEVRMSNVDLLKQVSDLLNRGDGDGAYEVAQTDDSYAARVMAGALRRRTGGYLEVKDGLIEAASVESFRINARISLLSLVGNIGPLLGLLGTVTGMISSFQVIEQLKAPTPGDLAKGVYESLVNTTLGLFIAIVFLSFYFFLKNKISDITLRVNTQISDILSSAFVYEGGGDAGRSA